MVFFATRCYYRFWGSGLLIHLILLILLSSPSNHILEACRSQAHVDHISRLCGLGSMSAKTAMIFSTQICFRLFAVFLLGAQKLGTYPYKPKRSRVILQPHVKSNTTEQTRSWQILIVHRHATSVSDAADRPLHKRSRIFKRVRDTFPAPQIVKIVRD